VPTPQLSQRGGRQISECGTDILNNHKTTKENIREDWL
jgi:hypothetical protein